MASTGEGSALQVIVLGSGGGPQENNITAFLVRSVAERWSRGSVLAVDAGVHLAAITKILEASSAQHLERNQGDAPEPPDEREPVESEPAEHEHVSEQSQQKPVLASGPFKGMELQRKSAKGNASYVTGVLVETFLITHPHLDHISGLVVNTAGMTGPRPKQIAGLPSTIDALKVHIFNDLIWPNLSDEDNGAGLIKYVRLVEGGPPALDEKSETAGFVTICKGLQVKTWGVSHGNCAEHPHHQTASNNCSLPAKSATTHLQFRTHPKSQTSTRERAEDDDTSAIENHGVYDSCAFFIRDVATGKEVLIFGDVEPDSISRFPRNRRVWCEAAPKIVAGQLGGIFVECSYDDTRTADTLFGHLAPRYVIEEITMLAAEVTKLRCSEKRKRKRTLNGCVASARRKPPTDAELDDTGISPEDDKLPLSDHSVELPPPVVLSPARGSALDEPPLQGIRVIIIHIKERFDDDTNVADTIYRQLLEHEKQAQLGCEFIISSAGQSLYF